MKNLLTLVFVAILGIAAAQNNFEKGMLQAFELWNANKIENALNLFERIGNAEANEWLPHYYIAQINSIRSWNVKDEAVLKAQLDKAQEHLNTAMAISPNNPELLVMQAQIYTNWVAFDGSVYGIKYAAKVTELYAKAKALEPDNPRAAFCSADWAMGSARYFGQDTAPFCQDIEASVALFDNYERESKLHPNWGKERAQEVSKQCK